MIDLTRRHAIPFEEVRREMNERHAQIPEATMERVESALEVLGNELARRSAIADLGDQPHETLGSAMEALVWVEWVLKGTLEPEDFLDLAQDVRDSLDRVLATETNAQE